MTEQHFVLKPDGKIYWIQEPVKVPAFASSTRGIGRYKQSLQSAISNAVEVSNQKEVTRILYNKYSDDGQDPEFQFKIGEVLSLQCSVEKKEFCEDFAEEGRPFECPFYESERHKTVALVTFSKPEDKETQEELEDGVQLTLSMNLGTFGRVIKALKTDPELWEEVKDELTRLSKEFKTRKTP